MFADALERCVAPRERAYCLPPEVYREAAWHLQERIRVFGRGWIGLGRADRPAEPGAYEAVEIARRPVLLVRDRARPARAFAKSCRHRGALLLDGAGQGAGIRCPFHAWLYRLDGSLAAAPRRGAARGGIEPPLTGGGDAAAARDRRGSAR